ncbi:MAG: hypothetical protein ABIT38_07110, partial [Gemmatimonadaceae bacterium]
WMFAQLGRVIIHGSAESVVARIRTDQQGIVDVRRRHIAESTITNTGDGELSLYLRFKNGSAQFAGAEAERIASIILPKVNRFGGKKDDVAEAVRHIENVGDSEHYLRRLASASPGMTRSMTEGVSAGKARRRQSEFNKYGLYSLPAPHRLALEMALHEEAERRALEGELAELERAWIDAEEVAAISDNLLLPESVDEQFKRMKGKD